MNLRVRGLHGNPSTVYELWCIRADGRWVSGGTFWAGAAESYGALLARSGLLAEEVVDRWRAFQARSAADNTLFAASNYYTYLAHRPD